MPILPLVFLSNEAEIPCQSTTALFQALSIEQ